ncbi:MAG: ATP-binding cassette domain-containing protein [Ferruginibacter sp.]
MKDNQTHCMLSISNFQKKYPGNAEPVLRVNSFEIGKGIYWIKGENGSGKTTLLKSIAGMIPFEGSINVDGLDIHKNRKIYSSIVNYAEAEPRYPIFLTGKELIDFYKASKGGEFPANLLKNLGVEKFKYQKTGTYSSGMLKKISLVLAFTGTPTLVMLDEPLIALDIAAVEVLHGAIRQYIDKGVSFIITSHQPLNSTLLAGTTTLLLTEKTLQKEKP